MSVTQAKPLGAGKSIHNPISVIILAAGDSKRMSSLGAKSTIKLNNDKTLLDYQISVINHVFPHNDITLVIGFEANHVLNIIPKGIKIVENERFDDTNTTRSAQLGLRVTEHDNVLIVHGDIAFNKEFLDGLSLKDSAIGVSTHEELERCPGTNIVDGNVLSLFPGKSKSGHQWAQSVFLRGVELEAFRALSNFKAKERMYIWELFNEIIDKGCGFKGVDVSCGQVVNITSYKDVDRAKGVFGL